MEINKKEPPGPNFFLVGAPKCGTTSVASWLAERPDVFMCDPKEPFFLGDDLRPLAARQGIDSLTDYLRLFQRAGNAKAVGEASTLYLSSDSARECIKREYPNAKLMVMLRNPVQLAQAFHMQACYAGYEPETDFETAWNLEPKRINGECVPKSAIVPRVLHYRKTASLGTQLRSWKASFEDSQLLCLLIDDLVENPVEVAQQIEDFLEVSATEFSGFPHVNSAMVARSKLLVSLCRGRQAAVLRRFFKGCLPKSFVRSLAAVQRTITSRSHQRHAIHQEFQDELRACFREEVELLADLTGRNLSHWL